MSRARSRAALIRLRQWTVDEIRKEVSALEAERQALMDKDGALQAQALVERSQDMGDMAARMGFTAFAQRVLRERAVLAEQVVALDAKIEAVRVRLGEAFLDLKQLEIAERERLRREQAEAARLEAMTLDDIALQGFLRRDRGGNDL
ncbi:MAG: hypothetical protein ACFB6R_04350 [Alphaproteobacteria bacterium]